MKPLLMPLMMLLLFVLSCERKVENASHSYVNDSIRLLSPSQRDSLNAELAALERSVGSQIVILIVESLHGRKIEEYSITTATKWGIGRTGYNDGVLITVALQDRQMRIEVGTGLENIIKDEIAAKIIHDDMAPRFIEQQYFEGLYAAVVEIKKLITENKDRIGECSRPPCQ